MDDNLAWCPVCDRQILPRFVPVNPLQPTVPPSPPVPKTSALPPTEAVAVAPIVLPPPVKTARPGLRKSRTAAGRVKRVSPPKNNEQIRRINTQHNLAEKPGKSAKKKVNRRLPSSLHIIDTRFLSAAATKPFRPAQPVRPRRKREREEGATAPSPNKGEIRHSHTPHEPPHACSKGTHC
jgi:hypothetical protein